MIPPESERSHEPFDKRDNTFSTNQKVVEYSEKLKHDTDVKKGRRR